MTKIRPLHLAPTSKLAERAALAAAAAAAGRTKAGQVALAALVAAEPRVVRAVQAEVGPRVVRAVQAEVGPREPLVARVVPLVRGEAGSFRHRLAPITPLPPAVAME